MLQLENNELQGLKLQHDQKLNDLEKTQVAVLEVSVSSGVDKTVEEEGIYFFQFPRGL